MAKRYSLRDEVTATGVNLIVTVAEIETFLEKGRDRIESICRHGL
jgi:hypothetical protein